MEQQAADSSSQTRPVWWGDWQRLEGCHPGHERDSWFFSEEEANRPLTHVGALESDSND